MKNNPKIEKRHIKMAAVFIIYGIFEETPITFVKKRNRKIKRKIDELRKKIWGIFADIK